MRKHGVEDKDEEDNNREDSSADYENKEDEEN